MNGGISVVVNIAARYARERPVSYHNAYTVVCNKGNLIGGDLGIEGYGGDIFYVEILGCGGIVDFGIYFQPSSHRAFNVFKSPDTYRAVGRT